MADTTRAADAVTLALSELAVLAERQIDHTDGAGVTLLEPGGPQIGASNELARAVDLVQYGCGEGPCISAVEHAMPMTSGRIGHGETRWPRFVAGSAATGLRSVLSFPLRGPEQVEGSLNLYSRSAHAFDAVAILQAEMFLAPLAVAMRDARVLSSLDVLAGAVTRLLDERTVVDVAVGVLCAQEGLTSVTARRRLAELAGERSCLVIEVARTLVEQAAATGPGPGGGRVGMDVLEALAADFRDLVVDLDQEAYTPGTLSMLQRDLRLAVRSSLGYSVSLVREGSSPVSVHVIDEALDLAEVGGSMLVELARLGPYAGGTVTFYASRAGAFDELAVDMRGLLLSPSDPLTLDGPLPAGRIAPGVAGLTDFSQVNYAVGVLLTHGLSLDAAREELQRRASRDDVGLLAAARTVLHA